MIITLKDGSTKEYAQPMSVYEIAKDISEGLARVATAGELDGEVVDLRTVVDKDSHLNILTFEDEKGAGAFRHTTSHIMAQAIKRLYPNIKLAIGPSIADGFYYDVDSETPLTTDDLEKIEKEMKKIVKEDLTITHYTKSRADAIAYFKEKGFSCVKVNSKKGGGVKSIQAVIQEACKEKMERDRKRGILNRPVRAMVVGIPNVGKSTFINALAGKACAKTGNKPGVTKGKQWIRLNKNVELLDTPGILWPKFEDQSVGLKLAFIGSIKDEILNAEELAAEFITFAKNSYPGVLADKYSIVEAGDSYECLRAIAESRHCLVRGNELDTEKAAALLLDDFRNGRLGRLTLEYPEE